MQVVSHNWTADQVEGLLNDAHAKLDTLTEESGKLKEAEARSKATYDIGVAKATLTHRTAKMPITDAKAAALVDCSREYSDHLMAKAVAAANRDAQVNLQKQVDLLRTLMVSARAIV